MLSHFHVCARSVIQSCPTLCNPMDCSPWGSSVHGIPQAGLLEWVAISPSRGFSWSRDQTHVSCISCIASRFFIAEPTGKPYLTFTDIPQAFHFGYTLNSVLRSIWWALFYNWITQYKIMFNEWYQNSLMLFENHTDVLIESIIVWSSHIEFVTQNFVASYLQIGQGCVLSW